MNTTYTISIDSAYLGDEGHEAITVVGSREMLNRVARHELAHTWQYVLGYDYDSRHRHLQEGIEAWTEGGPLELRLDGSDWKITITSSRGYSPVATGGFVGHPIPGTPRV
jgi:hypothetical protein